MRRGDCHPLENRGNRVFYVLQIGAKRTHG
jgi:hypothetical protein